MSNQPITVGELIRLLEAREPDAHVRFDFEHFAPIGLDSYRGFYDHLAFGFSEKADPTVADVLAMLRGAIGQTFHGWKGGDYVMDERTPLWVANRGNSGSTAVVGLADCEWATIIATAFCGEWDGAMESAIRTLRGAGVIR